MNSIKLKQFLNVMIQEMHSRGVDNQEILIKMKDSSEWLSIDDYNGLDNSVRCLKYNGHFKGHRIVSLFELDNASNLYKAVIHNQNDFYSASQDWPLMELPLIFRHSIVFSSENILENI